MAAIVTERVSAEPQGEIVLFLIGMRINRLWKVWQWPRVARAMTRMLKELTAHPELGLLHAQPQLGLRNLWVVQWWRSAADLQAYAGAESRAHLPAWRAFYRTAGRNGDVGIWHETYVTPPGGCESIYFNMPRHGLAFAAPTFPSKRGRASAADRLASGAQTVHDPVRAEADAT